MDIVNSIIQAIGPKLAAVLIALSKCTMSIVKFLEHRREDKKEEAKKEEKKKEQKKIDDVCDNGTIEDLLNL